MLRNRLLVLALFLAATIAQAQTTYHLHVEHSTINAANYQLKTAGPDTGWTSIQQSRGLLNAGPGEYFLAGFETQSGVPGIAGLIPAGSTVTFKFWGYQHPNCSPGSCPPLTPVYPKFHVKNTRTGVFLCSATGTAPLNVATATLVTLSCATTADMSWQSTDRFYLNLSVNSIGSYGQMAGINIEGTSGGQYDDTLLLPRIIQVPSISSLVPNSGQTGTYVRINGSNFMSDQASTVVRFNGVAATVVDWRPGWLGVTVPSAATTGNVTVSNRAGTSNGVLFTVTNPPSISGVSPSTAVRGTSVSVTGTYFGATQGSSTVTFNGVAGTPTAWSDTQITVPVPDNATSGNIVVTTQYGSSNGYPFTVAERAVLSSLEPPSGAARGTITIHGTSFGATRGASSVQFNGVAIDGNDYLSWTDTAISVKVPQLSNGPATVTVVTYGASSNGLDFLVTDPPSLTSITPTSGPEGTPVTISGAAFGAIQSNSSASIGGVPISVTSWGDGEITGTVPAGTADGLVTVTVAQITGDGPVYTVDVKARLTDSLGFVSNFTSATKGGVKRLVDADGSGCSSCTQRGVVHNGYDAKGNLATTQDELLRVTDYAYDANNNMTSETKYLSGSPVATTYTYNSFGQVLTVTDALGNITENHYDVKGNLEWIKTPPPDGSTPASVTYFGYDTAGKGLLTSITDPLGHVTSISYTPEGLIQGITDPENHTTSYEYDARGNRTKIIDPVNGAANPTTFEYDLMDRLKKITYPDGTHTDFGYDYRGRRTSVTDQNNKTTTYGYDDADRLISLTDAATHPTTYEYDTENNLRSITDANQHQTSFLYDQFGRVIETDFPSSLHESYGYDAVGRLTSKTDRKSQLISYVYDALDRLTHKGYPDSSGVDYVYDLVGKLLQVNDPTGTYGFAYDNMGRLIGTTAQYSFLPGRAFSNTYGYDAASNRTSYSGDGGGNAYQYDLANRLTNLTSTWAGQFTFGYDPLNRRTALNRPNSVNATYGYDALSHLTSVLHKLGGTTIDGADYGYDNAGNRTSKTNHLNNTSDTYAYDSIYQLTQVTGGSSESYTYDNVGNRLSSAGVPTYSYNSSNQLISTTTATFTYDYNGNTLSKADASGSTTYAWDYENRLTSVTLPGEGGAVSFNYDPFGRRIRKIGLSGTMIYAYDGANVIGEFDGTGSAVALYAQGAGIDEPLAMSRAGAVSYYEADGLGSITSVTDTGGIIAESYTRDSFGNQLASTGSLVNPFRFTAREWDEETGLYYYRARYYEPQLGRFMSEDPVAFAGGINFYPYVNNSPVIMMDPFGLSPSKPEIGDTRWRNCKSAEVSFCVMDCASRGKTYVSCSVGQTYRILRLKRGPEWVDFHTPSCRCDDPGDEECAKRLKQMSRPTDFELEQRERSNRYMQRFWTWILVGDAAIGVVGTAGAFGLLGGSGAGVGLGTAPKPIPMPLPNPAPAPPNVAAPPAA